MDTNTHIAEELVPELPVLDILGRELGDIHPTTVGFFGLQHLLGSTATLVRRVVASRMSPCHVFLLGKPYSANPRVGAVLAGRYGYTVHPDSFDQPCDADNDALMDRRIGEMLDIIASRLRSASRGFDDRFLIIDDGGRAIRLLHDERYVDIRRRFACVEQTRCGIRTIAGIDLQVPVVNVAESRVKLEIESPLIAASVVRELGLKLGSLERRGITAGRRALICGYGAIGGAVAAEMRRTGYEVAVHDSVPARLARAAQRGYRPIESFETGLRRGGVIVGCTGLPLMEPRHHDIVADGALLISASSSDIEFRGWQLRSRGACLGDPLRWRADGSHIPDPDGRRWDHPCFSLYRIRRGGRTFHLVNGGFPVNFTGGVDPIEPDKIQLTRSLLYLGALQATFTRRPGLIDLDSALQDRLAAAFAARPSLLAA